MPDQRFADRRTRAGDEIESAVRHTRVAHRLRQQATAPWRGGRGLEHHGVAGHQCGARGSAGQRQGKVERRDHDPGTVRFQHTRVLADESRQRIAGHGPHESVVRLHLVTVVGDKVRRLLRLAQRLHAILADLERKHGTESVDAFLDERDDTPQHAHAFLPRQPRPRGKRALRRRDGGLRVHVLPCLEAAERDARIDRTRGGELARRAHVLSADQHRVLAVQLLPHLPHRGIEPRMQLRRRVEHRRIGQLVHGAPALGANRTIRPGRPRTRGSVRAIRGTAAVAADIRRCTSPAPPAGSVA